MGNGVVLWVALGKFGHIWPKVRRSGWVGLIGHGMIGMASG